MAMSSSKKSVYDGVPGDVNRAYDQPTRTGPIIPVNLINSTLPVPDQPLVVVWYHTNSLGVAWADSPCAYSPLWPTNIDPTNTLVIASSLGIGQPAPQLLNPYPYTQNDPTLRPALIPTRSTPWSQEGRARPCSMPCATISMPSTRTSPCLMSCSDTRMPITITNGLCGSSWSSRPLPQYPSFTRERLARRFSRLCP